MKFIAALIIIVLLFLQKKGSSLSGSLLFDYDAVISFDGTNDTSIDLATSEAFINAPQGSTSRTILLKFQATMKTNSQLSAMTLLSMGSPSVTYQTFDVAIREDPGVIEIHVWEWYERLLRYNYH